MLKNLALGIALMLFAAETVLAASISTRVRVLENKVIQFEKLVKESGSGNSVSKEQLAQIEQNTQDISLLKIRVEKMQTHSSNPNPKVSTLRQTKVSYLEEGRFTDNRYAYP